MNDVGVVGGDADRGIDLVGADADTPGESDDAGGTAAAPAPTPAAGRLALAALAITLLPLVVAAGRAMADGWVPVGDSALITVRARDVLGGGAGGDMPQLGMWASTSWRVGFDMNHPGPLLYVLLAVPAALVGGGGGVVVGTALVNVASVTGMFVVARRVGGDVAAIATLAVTAVLCWSFGSAVLVEPWHATTTLLPFLLLAVLVWAVVSGDHACLPWAAVVGSVVLQTNLSFAVLVSGLLLVAVAVVVHRFWRGSDRRRTARVLAITVVVGAVCWLLPIVEQLRGPGEGNLSRLWRSLGVETRTMTPTAGLRAVAQIVAVPPWFGPPSYGEAFAFGPFGNSLPSLPLALGALGVVVAAGAALGVGARRRGDRVVTSVLAVAGLTLALAVVTAGQTPTGRYGTVVYQMRWVWPVSAVVWLALVLAVARHPRLAGASRSAALALVAVVTVVSVANLPDRNEGTTAPPETYAVARGLVEAVQAADLTGPFEMACGEGVYDPYCEAVMAALQDDGVPFVVPPDGISVRQLGEQRAADPSAPLDRLVVVTGDLAGFTPAGAEVVTVHEGLTADETAELSALREELVAALADGEVRLDDDGERLARGGDLDSAVVDGGAVRIDPVAAVDKRDAVLGTHRRDLVALVHFGLLDADPGWWAKLERFTELQDRLDAETVSVYVEPAVPPG